jgi:excisionase family DNA binding protein
MKLFSVREAAVELCLLENTIYGLCKRRKLRHERHGLGRGKILIPEDALAEYRRRVTVGLAASVPPAVPRVKLKHLLLS